MGSPDFDDIGKALYVADFLEPGRKLQPKWRARLRAEMPGGLNFVAQAVVGKRVQFLIKKGRPVPTETFGLWNAIAEKRLGLVGCAWPFGGASASFWRRQSVDDKTERCPNVNPTY